MLVTKENAAANRESINRDCAMDILTVLLERMKWVVMVSVNTTVASVIKFIN